MRGDSVEMIRWFLAGFDEGVRQERERCSSIAEEQAGVHKGLADHFEERGNDAVSGQDHACYLALYEIAKRIKEASND
jgi:hypothetical protein